MKSKAVSFCISKMSEQKGKNRIRAESILREKGYNPNDPELAISEQMKL